MKIDLPTIETSSGPFGAIVGNLDLERPTQPSVARLLRDALATHKLLRFEVPEATPEIMTRLGRCFGVPHPYPHASPMPGHPLVLQIEKGRHDTVNFGGMWHADLIYDSNPSAATLVGMVQTPESGETRSSQTEKRRHPRCHLTIGPHSGASSVAITPKPWQCDFQTRSCSIARLARRPHGRRPSIKQIALPGIRYSLDTRSRDLPRCASPGPTLSASKGCRRPRAMSSRQRSKRS